jgi:hypothetical protein
MKKFILLLCILISSFTYSQDIPKTKCPLRYLLSGVGTTTLKRTTLETCEFVIKGDNKITENIKVSFQDIEYTSHRDVLFQGVIKYEEEIILIIPKEWILKTTDIVLLVSTANNSFHLTISITD